MRMKKFTIVIFRPLFLIYLQSIKANFLLKASIQNVNNLLRNSQDFAFLITLFRAKLFVRRFVQNPLSAKSPRSREEQTFPVLGTTLGARWNFSQWCYKKNIEINQKYLFELYEKVILDLE
jgi:hypothetical protein